jgi:LPS sulfotransferase NodH
MQYSYEKPDHELAVEEVFGESAVVKQIGTRLPCVIMCFVNRCGSNYIAELLKSTGALSGFQEALNAYNIRTLTPIYRVETFAEYLARYRSEDLDNNPHHLWGLKAGWMQLAMLWRTRAIPRLLDPTLLIVRRRDLIAQAISYHIAEETAQWKSTDQSEIPRHSVIYNGQNILDKLQGIIHSYSRLNEIALLANCPVQEIVYEDVLETPLSSIARLTRALVGRELTPVEAAVTIGIQRDKLNEEFKRRFLADLHEMEWRPYCPSNPWSSNCSAGEDRR